MLRGPIEISTRTADRGGSDTSAWSRDDIRGCRRLAIFVHRFNASKSKAAKAWAITDKTLSSVSLTRIDATARFYWPGDSETFSKLAYPTKIRVAERCGRSLGHFLAREGQPTAPLTVYFVGHSLGCRVVLDATEALRESTAAWVNDNLLMAAAVPVGLCEGSRKYFGKAARGDEAVLYSGTDLVLKWIFEPGQLVAQLRYGEPSPGWHVAAVGSKGGPRQRWSGQADVNLGHGQYWKSDISINQIAGMLGASAYRSLWERTVPERGIAAREAFTRSIDSRELR
jgi:pimeloyl-ACP methyl ester carboxylesterase